MEDLLKDVLDKTGFLYGWIKWDYDPVIVQAASDLLIAIACYALSGALLILLSQRARLRFRWLLYMLAALGLAGGTIHALGAAALWGWLPGDWHGVVAKPMTAALAATAAVSLWLVMPLALRMPDPERLQRETDSLRQELSVHRRACRATEASESRFRNAFDLAPGGMGLISPAGRWLQVNRRLCGMLGYTQEELTQTDFQSLIDPGNLEPTLQLIGRLLEKESIREEIVVHYHTKDGQTRKGIYCASRLRSRQTSTNCLIVQLVDLSEVIEESHGIQANAGALLDRQADELKETRRQMEKEMKARDNAERIIQQNMGQLSQAGKVLDLLRQRIDSLAPVDELTGLLSEQQFNHLLVHVVNTARRYGIPLSLLMVSVQTDGYAGDRGERVADELLAASGKALLENLRDADIIGRCRGRLIGVALPYAGIGQASTTAEKLRSRLETISLPDAEHPSICRIGLVQWKPQLTTSELLAEAERAVRKAAMHGSGTPRNARPDYAPDGFVH